MISTKKRLQENHVALAVRVVATGMMAIVTLAKKRQWAAVIPNEAIEIQNRRAVDVEVHAVIVNETILAMKSHLNTRRCQLGTRRSKA